MRLAFGYGLYLAQEGDKHPNAKPLKGFSGATVMELVERFDTNTYRAVYAVALASGVFVLHAFQKQSKRGIATQQWDIDLIRLRLRQAIGFDATLRRRKDQP